MFKKEEESVQKQKNIYQKPQKKEMKHGCRCAMENRVYICGDFGKNVGSLDIIILLNSIGCQTNISRENAFWGFEKIVYKRSLDTFLIISTWYQKAKYCKW